MKKINSALALILAVFMMVSLAACGQTAAPAAPAATTPTAAPASEPQAAPASEPAAEPDAPVFEEMTLTVGHNSPESSAHHLGCVTFKEYVEEATGGKVKVNIYSNGQLGSESELIEGIVMGTVDLAYESVGTVSTYAPNFAIFTLPYLIKDTDHLEKVLDSEVGTTLLSDALKAGIKVFPEFWMDGVKSYYNSKHEVNTPEDLAGLKLRVPNWAPVIGLTEMYGASAVVMSFNELYVACSNGTIDGFDATPSTAVNNNFNEVAKYLCLDEHSVLPAVLVMNPKLYDSMSPELQQVVDEAAAKAAEVQKAEIAAQDSVALDVLKEKGVIVTVVDKSAFKEKAVTIYEQFYDKIDQDLIQLALDLA